MPPSNTTQIDAVQYQAKSRQIYFETCRGKILQIWELKRAFLQNFVPHGEAIGIPVDYFDAVAAFIFEDEKAVGEWVKMHGTADDAAQSIETFAHIGFLSAQKNSRMPNRANQRADSLSA